MSDEFVWDEKQLEAIEQCCDINKRIVAVTGKAGTGKTLLLREISMRLRDAGYIVQTSAPTGKAAKRIRESTGLHAMTNHRMLGYGMPLEHEVEDDDGKKKIVKLSTGPRYDRMQPFEYDTILCDEYAMVNQEINRNLIDALKRGARICMFGDVNQLKPIEENPMLDKEPSAFQNALKRFTSVTLDIIHRQGEGSGISQNGALILDGKMPKRHDDFQLAMTDQPVQLLQSFVAEQFDGGISYADTDHQIITCMNKSWVGTQRLNLVIQSLFWDGTRPYIELPRHKNIDSGGIRVQVGSKVVYTANTYDMGDGESIFNGEVGIVSHIDFEEGSLELDLGDRTVLIPPMIIEVKSDGRVIELDPRKNISHAYVLTTHKCQGSEYKHVCYVINRSTQYAQSRRNFYTAVTRAREKCIVIADMVSMTKSTKWAG